MTLNLGVTFFRFQETEEERQERYREDQLCWCGVDWQVTHTHEKQA
jgi:hypothetical protein